MKIFKIAFLLCLVISIACGPDLPFQEFYSLFYNDVSAKVEYKDYAYGGNNYYSYNDYYSENIDIDNSNTYKNIIKDWVQYTNGKLKAEEIEIGFMERNPFAEKLTKLNKLQAAEYITILNDVKNTFEFNYSNYENTNEDLKNQKNRLNDLYNVCDAKLQTTKDKFLVERYIYLMSQLDLKINVKTDFIETYSKYAPKFNSKSSIYPLIQSNAAGSFYKLGNNTQAFKIYSKLFAQYPELRERIYQSISTQNIPFTNAVENSCKNTTELANAYAVTAILPKIDGLAFIEKAYANDPDNPLIEIAFNREINKMEKMYFSRRKKQFDFWEEVKDEVEGGKKQLNKLATFSDKIIREGKRDATFWHMSNSYFHLLNNKIDDARISLTLANPIEDLGKKQLSILSLFVDLADEKLLDESAIAKSISSLVPLRSLKRMEDVSMLNHSAELLKAKLKLKNIDPIKKESSFFSGCNNKRVLPLSLTDLQKARSFAVDLTSSFISDSMKNSLFQRERQVLYDTTSIDYLEAFENLYLKSTPTTSIDKSLLQATEIDEDGFYKALGRKYILLREFDKASIAFSKLSDKSLVSLKCYENTKLSDSLLQIEKPFNNPSEYCKGLANYKNQAEQGDEEAAFKYAMHLYNLSYFGKAWILSKSYWSSEEPKDRFSYPVGWTDDHIPSYYYNLSDFKDWIKKYKVKNREIKAKLDYLNLYVIQQELALNQKYINDEHWNNSPAYNEDENDRYDAWQKKGELLNSSQSIEYKENMRRIFTDYYKKYRNTEYGKRVLEECGYASQFTTQ